MRQLLQSMNNNQETKFNIQMKDISADKDIKIEKDVKNSALNFDPQNPEGKYTLDLAENFNQICLQHLVQAAEKAVERSEGAFEMKNCFVGARLNGKSKWEPPSEKSSVGLFNLGLGEEPKGSLEFQFTLNPPALKEYEKQLRRATDDGDVKKLAQLKANEGKPIESVDAGSITKQIGSDSMANNFFDMLIERYQDEDENNMLALIKNLSMENSIWFSQAHESLYVCKFQEQFL